MGILELILVAIGGFGFGYGLAERDHRKTLRKLDNLVTRIETCLKDSDKQC